MAAGKNRQLTFQDLLLTKGLETVIRNANPWWEGERVADLPRVRRWPFPILMKGVKSGLTPAMVLTGPRQVGKTTLLNQIINQLLDEGVNPKSIFKFQFDDFQEFQRQELPIIELCDWYVSSVLQSSFAKAARTGNRPIIFLDEVQNLADWAPQLKNLVDLNPVHVLVTGSSALRIEAGRDSLAGRITTVEMGPLLLREIAAIRGFGELGPFLSPNGLGPIKEKKFWIELRAFGESNHDMRKKSFDAFSDRGAYPLSQARADEPWEHVADSLNETIIMRAIRHDLRMGPKGQKRDESLLKEVFRIACRYIGQAPSPNSYVEEINKTLQANVGPQRIRKYLDFLDGTLLIRLIEPLEMRLKKKRSPPKLCLCDHGLRAAWLQEVVPLSPEKLESSPHLSDLAGRIAESAAGYFFRSIRGLDVAHFPGSKLGKTSEPEVDFVLTIGEQRIPIEIKYRRRIDFADTHGLRSFLDKPHNNAPFAILVTLLDDTASDDPRIVSIPLSTLLLLH